MMIDYSIFIKQLNKALPYLVKVIKKNDGGILKINLDTSKGMYITLTDNGQYRYLQKGKPNSELDLFFACLKDYSVVVSTGKDYFEINQSQLETTTLPLVTSRAIVLSVPLAISDLEDFLTELVVMCHILIKNSRNFFIELALNNKILVNNFTTDQELLTHHELLNLPLLSVLSKQFLALTPIKKRNTIEKELSYLGKIKQFLLFTSENGLFIINQESCERLFFRIKAENNKNIFLDKEILLIPQKIDFSKTNSELFNKNIQFLRNNGFNFNQTGDITSFSKLFTGIDLTSVINYLIEIANLQQQIDWVKFSQKIEFLPHEVKPYELLETIFKLDFKKYKMQLHDVLRMIDIVYLESLFNK